MRHVQKQQWLGCAIATTAMMADVTYEEAEAALLGISAGELRWSSKLRRALDRTTRTLWKSRWLWRSRRMSDFQFPDWPVATCLEDGRWLARRGQWIVVRGDLVHDPEFRGATLIRQYARRDWWVKHVLEPVRPAELKPACLGARFEACLNTLIAESSDVSA